MNEAHEATLRKLTVVTRTKLVPEIPLHLARNATGIFQIVDEIVRPGPHLPPYWAFAWPAGQAAARHIFDNPEIVRGRRICDIGSGSGIAAIAAAKAGAAHVLAADIDPFAVAAIIRNARLNEVAIDTTAEDILGSIQNADILLIGDLVYEPETATRVTALLEAASRNGTDVLLADRTSARRPPVAFDFVGAYDARLTPALPAHTLERATLWRLTQKQRRQAPQ